MKFDSNTNFNVVGSGVASWIAVFYLLYNNKKVTMYRDPNVIVRRIGESTVPKINEISQMLGMTDDEFLARVNGHYKYGTMFQGWNGDSWLYYFANEANNVQSVQRETFAYHIDAPGFTELMREHCLEKYKDTFTLVDEPFDLKNYKEDEFYIDSTGQQGILSTHVGIEHVETDLLLNDHAWIGNGPAGYKPYTNSKAMTAGWLWNISLKTRMSYGYVFSSKYLSIEDAKQEFIDNVGFEPEKLIPFKSRRPKQQWIGNVMALGMSAGFIEPLNATANFAAQSTIINFLKLMDKPEVFNRLMSKTYDGIHKWIRALYGLNSIQGNPYWDHYKSHREQAIKDIEFYSVRGHQGLMSKHSWNLLKTNMIK